MMWLMVLACAVPIIGISFAGSGNANRTTWAVLGLGLMFLLHWIVMKISHRHKPEQLDHSNANDPGAPDHSMYDH